MMRNPNGYFKYMEYDENFNNEEKIQEYQMTHDKELRNRIIENNLPLVFSVAYEYCYPARQDVNDLISIGVFGLMEAIDKFEFTNKFSTYARTAIKNSIVEEVCKEAAYGKYHYGRYVIRFRQLAIAEFGETNFIFTAKVIDYILDKMIEENEMSKKTAEPVRRIIESMGNLATPEEIESIPYEDDYEDFEQIEFIREYYDELVSVLTEKELLIIRRRMGFVNGKVYNQRELGEELGMTHQNVSLKEKTALKKMHKVATRYI